MSTVEPYGALLRAPASAPAPAVRVIEDGTHRTNGRAGINLVDSVQSQANRLVAAYQARRAGINPEG